MDETGHSKDQEQRFNGIAGLLASVEHWEQLEPKWKATLAEFKIPYFHTVDWAHSTKHFKGWSKIKRERLFGKLLKHIEGAYPFPLGQIIYMEDFRNLSETQRKIFEDPYHLSFACVLEYVAFFLEKTGVATGEKAALVFSEQVEFRDRALQYYEHAHTQDRLLKQRIEPPTFDNMRTLVALQAADIVAYEFYKECERLRYRPNDKPRYGYGVLVKMRNRLGFQQPLLRFQDKKELLDLAESAEKHSRRLSYWAKRKAAQA